MDAKLKETCDAILYVAGALTELKRAGLISGGIRTATPMGLAKFDQLHANGYRPDLGQIVNALRTLFHDRAIEPAALFSLALLVNKWEETVELYGPSAANPDECDCSVCENRKAPGWRFYVQFAGIGVVVLVIVVLAVLELAGE